MSRFENPQAGILNQNLFGDREVGLTHPDVPGFFRIKDSGDIEIVAGEGLSITMNVHTRSITFVADTVKFMTKSEGFRWNNVTFNDKAVSFNEPTFLSVDDSRSSSWLYRDVQYYTGASDE